MHTDIRNQGWIKALPDRLQPYARLARLDRPIGIWLLALPGWWAIVMAGEKHPDWRLLTLFGIGAVMMRAAGCVINDLWDRKLDQKVERTSLRPLAAGEISLKQAFVFLAALLMVGLAVLLQMNEITIWLGISALPLIVAYPLMKRITWWPQAFLGLTFNFCALMGWSAVTGRIEMPSVFLYLAGIFWTLGYDTIYAHQDKEDDLRAGIKSTALKFGAQSKLWIGGFYAASWAFLCMAFAFHGQISSILFSIPAVLHLVWQIKAWDMNDAANTLRIFKSNRDYGILVLAGMALGL